MKKKKSEKIKTLEAFMENFEDRILSNRKNLCLPTEKEVSDCIDSVVAPAMEAVREKIDDFYESVTVEKDQSSAVITIMKTSEIFSFEFGFTGKNRTCLMKSSIKSEFFAHKTLTVFELANTCDALLFANIAEIDVEKIIELFDFNFWWLFEQRQIFAMYRLEEDMKFPY